MVSGCEEHLNELERFITDKIYSKLGEVSMPIIIATWEAEIWRICSRPAWVKSQQDPHFKNKTKTLVMLVHAYDPSYAGSISRRINVQVGLSKKKKSKTLSEK
jgi:hypothetical protein